MRALSLGGSPSSRGIRQHLQTKDKVTSDSDKCSEDSGHGMRGKGPWEGFLSESKPF